MADPVTERKVGRLLWRAAFGASVAEIKSLAQNGLEATVDRLVNYDRIPADALPDPPDLTAGPQGRGELPAVQLWWLDRMVRTPRPLEEKMTLFWHNHFATANYKVGSPALMYRQNHLFRTHALGNFRSLLSEVTTDPAMLIWLDGNTNRKASPNENYAREVMELFTMGIGNYTEQDVKEGARAFTGWRANREGLVVFLPRQHDDSEKTFLGRRGKFRGDDMVDILVRQRATAERLARRLFAFFAYPDPDSATVARLADIYLQNNFEIRPVVRAILLSQEMYSDRARHTHVKSPVELVVGALRAVGAPPIDRRVLGVLAMMGQPLFNPPNVAGWPGELAWIDPSTMLARFNFAASLPALEGADLGASALSGETSPERLVAVVLARLGLAEVRQETLRSLLDYARTRPASSAAPEAITAGLWGLVAASPDYQVTW